MDTFVLDASALIAFLNDEEGADKVDNILQRAKDGNCTLYMNKINTLEVYYGVYREDGKEKAEGTLTKVSSLPLTVVDALKDDVFKEAGRLKATYKISLADSIAIAETKIRNAQILTADHHELDTIEKKEDVVFHWVR